MKHLPVIASIVLFLAGVPALAQISALKGLDTSGPIDIDAARLEGEYAANQALFSGDVIIRQGKLTLYADSVKVLYRAKAGNPEVQRVDARGKVRLVTPSERGSADIGIYDIDGRIITMTGNVSLDRGGSILKGQRLVINLDTGQSSIDARSAARPGQPAGRVTGRFTVPARR